MVVAFVDLLPTILQIDPSLRFSLGGSCPGGRFVVLRIDRLFVFITRPDDAFGSWMMDSKYQEQDTCAQSDQARQ